MKKLLAILLATIMLTSLSACGDEETLDELLNSIDSYLDETDTSHAEDQEDMSQADGSQADGSQVDSSQTDGSQTDSSQTDSGQADGSQAAEGDQATEPPEETNNDNSVYFSTNDLATAKKGNSGVFAYRSRGGTYYRYWIIDFDEGYVYYFTDGNGESTCDRIKIDSGDLNSLVIFTYHAGGTTWQNALNFAYKKQPEHLIFQDSDANPYDYYATDLDEALTIRDTKSITDY